MRREIEFASHPGNLCLVRDFVRKFLHGADFPDTDKDLMILGLDEACTNVIRYAYGHRADQLMRLVCERFDDGVVFRLRDFGEQADPEKLQGRPLELIQPGGLGIHLIHHAFTNVDYHRKTQGTELVLAKRFAPKPTSNGTPCGN
ncbi:MAG TPA: ATP-binding protein [Chthoniobacteraceae bacterium]|nr:ATP-binding protein [Chthoniobacteraceae bacterium]